MARNLRRWQRKPPKIVRNARKSRLPHRSKRSATPERVFFVKSFADLVGSALRRSERSTLQRRGEHGRQPGVFGRRKREQTLLRGIPNFYAGHKGGPLGSPETLAASEIF